MSEEVCSIIGCGKARSSRGFCANHYYRLRVHGDPLAGRSRASPGEPQRWIKEHVSFAGDECLIWPFMRGANGYPVVRAKGRQLVASRVMCIEAHGEPPTKEHEAAHSCGKGHDACMNPSHLSWKTGSQNQADRHLHGTDCAGVKNPAAKLIVRQVRQIRRLIERGQTQTSVAQEFGISQAQVWAVKERKSWSHI